MFELLHKIRRDAQPERATVESTIKPMHVDHSSSPISEGHQLPNRVMS